MKAQGIEGELIANRLRHHLGRHLVALIILTAIDLHRWLRRRFHWGLLQVTVTLFGLALAGMGILSLTALIRVIQDTKSLTSDSLVGVDASISIRNALRGTREEMLYLRLKSGRQITQTEVETLGRNFNRLIAYYRSGAFEAEDQTNADRIESNFNSYYLALRPLVGITMPDPELIERADVAARGLIKAIDRGYIYNLDRLQQSAVKTRDEAEEAVHISKLLCLGFVIFAAVILATFGISQWLALAAEDGEALGDSD